MGFTDVVISLKPRSQTVRVGYRLLFAKTSLMYSPSFPSIAGHTFDGSLNTNPVPSRAAAGTRLDMTRPPMTCNYSPPHRDAFLLLDQQLMPISSRCRVESNCR